MNYNCKCNEDESGERNITNSNKLIGKQDEVLLYELNGLEYLIQIIQMSHDFLRSEICFISNKRILEVL